MGYRNSVRLAVNVFGIALILGTLVGIGLSYLCELSSSCPWERWPLIQIVVLLFFSIIIVLHFFGIIGELFDSLVCWEKRVRPDRRSLLIRMRDFSSGRLYISDDADDENGEWDLE